MSKKIFKAFKNPTLLLMYLCEKVPFRIVSDKTYIKLFFKAYHGYNINLDNPRTFNEKIQWLKLFDRNPNYTLLSDKYLVRNFVSETIGSEFLIPLLGVWDFPKDINFNSLPNQFVLKCNHDSGSVIICNDKSSFDEKKAIRDLNKSLRRNYFWHGREYNYKNIKRKIIAERLISDEGDNQLTDYKFFCFNGMPYFIQVDRDRFTNHIRNYYDIDWNFIDVQYGCKNSKDVLIEKPKKLELMVDLAKRLSKGMPHVRVDFYECGESVYFGEMTFHHGGGAMRVEPFKYDEEWGDLLILPKK